MPPDLVRGASQSPKSSPSTLSSSLMYVVLERWQQRLALLPAKRPPFRRPRCRNRYRSRHLAARRARGGPVRQSGLRKDASTTSPQCSLPSSPAARRRLPADAAVLRPGLAGGLTQCHGYSPRGGVGVDRGVGRRPAKYQRHVCLHSKQRVASLQVKRLLRTSVLLLKRRSR